MSFCSPCALCVCVCGGGCLSQVCGVDLRDASDEQAVEAIRRAGDCVSFLVQSGQHRSQVLRQNKDRYLLTIEPSRPDAKRAALTANTCRRRRTRWKHLPCRRSPSLTCSLFLHPQSPLLNRERATAAPQSNSHGGKVTL